MIIGKLLQNFTFQIITDDTFKVHLDELGILYLIL